MPWKWIASRRYQNLISKLNTDIGNMKFVYETTLSNYDNPADTGVYQVRYAYAQGASYSIISFDLSWISIQFRNTQMGACKLQCRVVYGGTVGAWTTLN